MKETNTFPRKTWLGPEIPVADVLTGSHADRCSCMVSVVGLEAFRLCVPCDLIGQPRMFVSYPATQHA